MKTLYTALILFILAACVFAGAPKLTDNERALKVAVDRLNQTKVTRADSTKVFATPTQVKAMLDLIVIPPGGSTDTMSLSNRIDKKYGENDSVRIRYLSINGNLSVQGTVNLNSSDVLTTGAGTFNSGLSVLGTYGSSYYWIEAYKDRMKWDGGSTGLNAITGRASLGLQNGAMADTNGLFFTKLAAKQNAGTYLVPNDTTNARAYSDAKYALKGSGGTVTDTTSLSNRINLKLNISDTTTFNSKTLTNAQLATKQNIISNLSDTSKYVEKADTTFLLAGKLATKQPTISNLADTSKYVEQSDTTFLLAGKLALKQAAISNLADTAKYVEKADTTYLFLGRSGSGISSATASALIHDSITATSVNMSGWDTYHVPMKLNDSTITNGGRWYGTASDSIPSRADVLGLIGTYRGSGTSLPANMSDTSKYIEYADTTVKIAMQWELDGKQAKGNYLTTSDSTNFNAKTLATAQLAYKLNITDTTNFNAKSLTTAQLATKQNVISNLADTAKYVEKTDTTGLHFVALASKVGKADIYTIGQPLALDSSMMMVGRVFPMMIGQNEVVDSVFIVVAGASCSFTANFYCSQTNFTAVDSLLSAVWTVTTTNGKTNKVTADLRNSGSLGTRIWWFKLQTAATKPDAIVVQLKGHRI